MWFSILAPESSFKLGFLCNTTNSANVIAAVLTEEDIEARALYAYASPFLLQDGWKNSWGPS